MEGEHAQAVASCAAERDHHMPRRTQSAAQDNNVEGSAVLPRRLAFRDRDAANFLTRETQQLVTGKFITKASSKSGHIIGCGGGKNSVFQSWIVLHQNQKRLQLIKCHGVLQGRQSSPEAASTKGANNPKRNVQDECDVFCSSYIEIKLD